MNTFEYRGHTVEIKPFGSHCYHGGVALPSLYDCFVDGIRRRSGFLQAFDAALYGQALVDDEVDKIPALMATLGTALADALG